MLTCYLLLCVLFERDLVVLDVGAHPQDRLRQPSPRFAKSGSSRACEQHVAMCIGCAPIFAEYQKHVFSSFSVLFLHSYDVLRILI